MFKWGKYLFVVCIFIIGWLACAGYDYANEQGKEMPYSVSGAEIYSPGDWIAKEQIKLYNNSVLLKIENATIAGFTDTNSMDPVIDEHANSIEIMPVKDKLKIGDIVSYEFEGKKIIHRIIGIGKDEQGVYYILKGDNNNFPDKEKVGFERISGVVIGILY